jgi:hypothetical protein
MEKQAAKKVSEKLPMRINLLTANYSYRISSRTHQGTCGRTDGQHGANPEMKQPTATTMLTFPFFQPHDHRVRSEETLIIIIFGCVHDFVEIPRERTTPSTAVMKQCVCRSE